MLLAESFDVKQAPEPREGMHPSQHIPRAGRDAKAPGAWRRRGQEVPAPGTALAQAPIPLLLDFVSKRYLLDRRAPSVWGFFAGAMGWRASALCTLLTKHCFRVRSCPPGPARAGLSAQQLPVPLSALRATQFHTFHFPPAAALTTSSKRGRPSSSCGHGSGTSPLLHGCLPPVP